MKHYGIFFAIALVFFISKDVCGQSWGLGLRLGDPSGLTIKRYYAGKALELNIGRTRFVYKSGWYDKQFYKWYDGKGFKYRDISYNGYRAAAPIAVQVHYLIQKRLEKSKKVGQPGLDWYYGFGGQLRIRTYYYDYQYKVEGGNWIYVSEERVPNADIGVDAVIGLEYKFKGPISLFLDGTLFMEVLDDPFLFWSQAGIGARFRF